MKNIVYVFFLLFTALPAGAQDYNGLWQKAQENLIRERGLPILRPARFASYTVSEGTIKSYLATAPTDYSRAIIMELPTPDGGYRAFRVWNTPAMEDGLATLHPEITTYTAEAIGARNITAKLDYTPFGFHAMVFDGSGKTYLVDPYSKVADGTYIAYYKSDYSRQMGQRMSCEVDDGNKEIHPDGIISLTGNGLPALRLNGTIRKRYRLALACTGEYADAVAGPIPTKALVLAQMVTSMNRVNGIYERELAVTMQLVANNTSIIYINGATDPYTNNSGSTMLSENQTTVDAQIGTLNYDIGHVFSTGGGGIASRGCVCQSNYKARGVTGSSSPTGDAFDVDYVAHEIGHQFGANHTFNGNTGSCANNGVASNAFEPGSGTTIMAYAGICPGNNIQVNSDAYFHSASLENITDYITLPNAGGTCPITITSANTNATVPGFTASYPIPLNTPFELTAPGATDATKDTLTYCWEQRDLGDFGKTLEQTSLAGPLFRSFFPTTSQTRIFPRIETLIGILAVSGEKLPDAARTLTFRLTERDVYQGWGTFNFPDDVITLNAIQSTGPFIVTSPVGGEAYTGGSTQTITWDVAGTAAAPISCTKVDIYMSDDGGITFPYLLKAGTPNDGSEPVTIRNVATTSTARIKVKSSGNVFFNISGGDFTVNHGTVGIGQAAPADDIRIAPVPARDVLSIDVPVTLGVMQLRVMNTIGQLVWSGTVASHISLDVVNWPRGLYQVQMHNEAGAALSRKIIVE